MSTQVEQLKARFAALQKDGLEDIKFVFGPLGEATLDGVCASVNAVLDAVQRGDYVDLPDKGDSRRAKR